MLGAVCHCCRNGTWLQLREKQGNKRGGQGAEFLSFPTPSPVQAQQHLDVPSEMLLWDSLGAAGSSRRLFHQEISRGCSVNAPTAGEMPVLIELCCPARAVC